MSELSNPASGIGSIELTHGWKLAPANTSGALVSCADFEPSGWSNACLPSTVMAVLVADGQIKDPYFGRNLEAIPTEQFESPWWYRNKFDFDSNSIENVRLALLGINYRAEVWLNGAMILSKHDIAGAFRQFEHNITPYLVDGENTLAIKVYPPEPGDPTIGFVDWNPTPPDKNMGIWRPVRLLLTGAVSMDRIHIENELDLQTLDQASLKISAVITNYSDQPTNAELSLKISSELEIHTTVSLDPQEQRAISFPVEEYPELLINQPRLWWPLNMGEANLYEMDISLSVNGLLSDTHHEAFGIRHVEDYLTEDGHRGYRVNGKDVLIRGGGWVDDLLLADDHQKVKDQLEYVRHMNLNTIRLEGFWGNDETIFNLADQMGILVMVGWSCQWEWENYLGSPVDEYGGIKTAKDIDMVARSLCDQVIWLRNHPSIFVWVLASDMLPRPELEKRYLSDLQNIDTSRPALASCADDTSEISGPTGVKMKGPYDYVPPNYWYLDTENGGAFGFNTETGPGPQPPPMQSIQRMMPEQDWWPVNEMWDYHSGRNEFNTIKLYHDALDARYGASESLEEFCRKSQAANYEAMRAMFEAFTVRRPQATGVVQWMLNSAWPELYWQLYDHYMIPNGAFYATRLANRPVNLVFDHQKNTLIAVNDTNAVLRDTHVRVRIYDLNSALLLDESSKLQLSPNSIQTVLNIPRTLGGESAIFLDARLVDTNGAELLRSFYWLPGKDDELDFEASYWVHMPIKEPADLKALSQLPPAKVSVEHILSVKDGIGFCEVTLKNQSPNIAFMLELAMLDGDDDLWIAPIFWEDNYISLLPDEQRKVKGRWPAHAQKDQSSKLAISGWNFELH